jgi:3',5'-cyclic AMP phosphodiesterase CpdA
MSRLIIDHLSDLHVGELHCAAEIRVSVAEQPKEPRNLALYRSHLDTIPSSDLPDLVVMSGDLTTFATEMEMWTIHGEIVSLVKILKRKETSWRKAENLPYVLIVPGNHDLDWKAGEYAEKIKRFSKMSSDLHRMGGVLSAIYDSTSPNDFHNYYDFGDECNLFVYLFNTTSIGGTIDPRLTSIHAKFKEIHDNLANTPPH